MESTPALPQGFTLSSFDKVGSTNDEARRLADAGAPHLTLVTAREQSAGRGRRGRVWESHPGNIHMSLVVRPACSLAEAAQMSFVAGLSVADALAAHGPRGVHVTCKWPNDILIERRKVAGLLLESGRVDAQGCVDYVIVGMGINVAWAPDHLDQKVTSLAAEGYETDCRQAIEAICHRLLNWIVTWRKLGFGSIRMAWLRRAHPVGAPLSVHLSDRTVVGFFAGIDDRGALIMEGKDGRHLISAGDVYFR